MESWRLKLVFGLLLCCHLAGAQARLIESWGSVLVDLQVGDHFDLTASGPQSEVSLAFDDQQGHTAVARAYVDYGRNHVFAATTSTGEQSTSSYAEAISVWNERFQINGGTGLAQASIEVRLDGDISSYGENAFAPLLTFELFYLPQAGVTFSQYPILWSSSSELASGVGAITPRSLVGEFTFEYEQPFILYGSLRALVAGNASIDVYHSARVVELAFPGAAQVSNDGGARARAALHVNGVPEPTSLAVTLVALMFVMWPPLRRRQK